ncbi:MAG: alanine:cation symporter family protein, partial [Flammeovirgaceae bacterium]|nr:alanine:cation symporter family protein [Flammeovirgaceae bacterium]MDW8287973.1 alanine/glycine:cation symporter family protein [Flammeovirgaceae bacterium]
GKYDDKHAKGEISPVQALFTALAATVGMGNISGVAVAIVMGGPGAIFWMWVTAFVGMATKFYTCSLSIMYRRQDEDGNPQGGPMYVIVEGLGKNWKPLAILFCIACMFGCLPVFQANQLTQIFREIVLLPHQLISHEQIPLANLLIGIVIMGFVSVVIFGGIRRIAQVAAKLVPLMIVLYGGSVAYIVFTHLENLPTCLWLILKDAFTGEAVLGGSLIGVMIVGAKRAAFSNEAGLGTASMMHGASKNNEPIREGLLAMLEPAIDTLLVCSMTAFAILVTDVWQTGDKNGIALTAAAFQKAMPTIGGYVLFVCVFVFAFTTLFSYAYYGTKSWIFLFGKKYSHFFNYLYVMTIVVGAVASITAVINLIDGMFALMAIPTMISTLLLSSNVKKAAKTYFKKIEHIHPNKQQISL